MARVIATGAQALAQAARHLPIAAAIPNFAPIAMAAGAGFAQVAANAPPFAAAFAAAPFGAAPLAHDPACSPRADEYEFSVTITAMPSGDIPPVWLEYFFRWLEAACVLGICSLERGKKDENLHIQSAVRMKLDSPPNEAFLKRMTRNIKKVLIGTINNKVSFKLFVPGQQMDMMTGYCLKDEGKPWHSHLSLNLPDEFKLRAKASWNAVRRSYEDAFVVLCRKNFFQQVRSTKFGLIFFVGIDLAFFRRRCSMMRPMREIFWEHSWVASLGCSTSTSTFRNIKCFSPQVGRFLLQRPRECGSSSGSNQFRREKSARCSSARISTRRGILAARILVRDIIRMKHRAQI